VVAGAPVRAVRVKLRHIPPNVATALNLILGLVAVMTARHGSYEAAAWIILWCVLLDKLDGTLARLFKAGSRFGVEFDSLADFCAFGVAPGLFAYEMLLGHPELSPVFAQGTNLWLLRGAVFLFVLAVGARLARFNVDTPVLGDKFFVGIPTTFVGGLLASFYLTCVKYELSSDLLRYFPVYLVGTGLLMVSTLRLPKFTRRQNRFLNYFQLANLAGVVVCGILRELPEYLFSLGVIYLVVGVVWSKVAGVRAIQKRV
jgi:CDP-diacylglycerol--serine O-phosphatidyltransferase